MTAAVVSMPTTSAFEAAFGGGHAKSSKASSKASNNNRKGSQNHPDALERFFGGWEAAFCGAPRSIQTLATEVVEEPDVLDYVFEHVESFTCTDDRSLRNDPFAQPRLDPPHNPSPQMMYAKGSNNNSFDDLSLRRENSLLEEGPNGAPTYLATARRRPPSRISKLGDEGDLLDYCFEHVESYVCATTEGHERADVDVDGTHFHKGTPTRNTTHQPQPQRHSHRTNRSSPPSPESAHPIPRVISTSATRSKKKKRRQKQNYYPDEEDNILLYYRPTKTD